MDEETRYQKLRERLCSKCPIRRTCSQFCEQLEACADAEQFIKLESDPWERGRELLRQRLEGKWE